MNDQTMSTPSTSSTPRKRIGITNSQRAALRRHARDHPRLRQAQLAAWYETEYGHKLSQGTISESLSNRFTELDNDITNPAQLDRQKARSEAWPELELALFEWYWRTKDNSPITNALLRTKAEWFWRRLAPYQGMEMPNFSNGWLDRFKKRHNIHRHRVSAATQYSAASGINLPVDTDRDDRFSEGHAADSDTGDGPVGDTYQNQAVPGPSRYPNHSRADGPSHYPMPSQEDAPDNLDDVSNHSDQSGRLETRPLDDVLPVRENRPSDCIPY